MNQTLIAIFFYFALCASIGYARGLKREMLVIGVSACALVALALHQRQIPATLWTHLATGDRSLPSWSELTLGWDWLTLRNQLQASPSALVAWLSACGGAYWFSQTRMQQGKNPRRWLGAVVSLGNGTLYLNLMVPLLSRNLLWPTMDLPQMPSTDLAGRTADLLNIAMTHRATGLTALAIVILVYLVSRRRQASN